MPEERRQNLAETDKGLYDKQEEWLEAFLEDKSAFFDGSESDDQWRNWFILRGGGCAN